MGGGEALLLLFRAIYYSIRVYRVYGYKFEFYSLEFKFDIPRYRRALFICLTIFHPEIWRFELYFTNDCCFKIKLASDLIATVGRFFFFSTFESTLNNDRLVFGR